MTYIGTNIDEHTQFLNLLGLVVRFNGTINTIKVILMPRVSDQGITRQALLPSLDYKQTIKAP